MFLALRHFFIRSVKSTDVVFMLFALTVSLLLFMGVFQGQYPYISLEGDAANVASFAAARTHPQSFQKDAVLGDLRNFGGYITLQFLILDALASITGDYGTASIVMLIPHIFVQMVGFYVLGRGVYRSRYLAFLLAILSIITVPMATMGEYWGVWYTAQPRLMFQALLPWLLALILHWHSHPKLYPLWMVLVGLLVYVHPVSAPGWGVAVWLSLVVSLPPGWSRRQKIQMALLCTAVYGAIIFPFGIHYLRTFRSGAVFDYHLIITLYRQIFGEVYFDLFNTLAGYLFQMMTQGPLALGTGIALILYWRVSGERPRLKMVLAWLAGLFVLSLVFPVAEQEISQRIQRLPSQLDLVRGIRYFYPLSFLFILWGAAAVPDKLNIRWVRPALYFLVGALVVRWTLGLWTYGSPMYLAGQIVTGCFPQYKFACPTDYHYNQGEMRLLEYIRSETPSDAAFLPANPSFTFFGNPLRYSARRSIVLEQRDANIFAYYNHTLLFEHQAYMQRLRTIMIQPDPRFVARELVLLAHELKVDYLILYPGLNVDLAELTEWNARVVFEAEFYRLVDLGNRSRFEANRINSWDMAPPVIGYCTPDGDIDVYGLENGSGVFLARASRADIEMALSHATAAQPVEIVRSGEARLQAISDMKLQLWSGTDYVYTFPAFRCIPESRRRINSLEAGAPIHADCVRGQGIEIFSADEREKLAAVSFSDIQAALARARPEAPGILTDNLKAVTLELLELTSGEYRYIFAASRCEF